MLAISLIQEIQRVYLSGIMSKFIVIMDQQFMRSNIKLLKILTATHFRKKS